MRIHFHIGPFGFSGPVGRTAESQADTSFEDTLTHEIVLAATGTVSRGLDRYSELDPERQSAARSTLYFWIAVGALLTVLGSAFLGYCIFGFIGAVVFAVPCFWLMYPMVKLVAFEPDCSDDNTNASPLS